ncbi:MAG TPA: copper chaperone PCu(A)C [Casimicrobiaceae bacterium]|nr:copper chaperone PCu(A)C [Casimicrobiaceae bacterium]
MTRILAIAAIAAIAVATSASAHDYRLRALHIDHPFARATPPGARSGGVFLSVENNGDRTDRLLTVSTPVAGSAELHQMVMDAGVMRMRAVAGVDVKPGDRLVLQPGGYHVMLADLKRPLQAGDTFPLTLGFEKAGSIEVSVVVESMAAGATHPHGVR